MSTILPGTRVYVLDDDCDDHIEIRVTPGIVRKIIVETEADADGGVCDLVSYDVEPEGAPSVRMRRLFGDVIEHMPTDTETRIAIGRAVWSRIERMRPACPRCGVALVGRHECELPTPPNEPVPFTPFVPPAFDDTQRGRNAYHAGLPQVAPDGVDAAAWLAGWADAKTNDIPF